MKRISSDGRIYAFSPENPPADSVSQGEEFIVECNDCFTGTMTADDLYSADRWESVNPATGPIEVEGAGAGEMLVVDVVDIKVPDEGLMITVPGMGALGHRFDHAETKGVKIAGGVARITEEVSVPVRPMLGVIGTAPGEGSIACGTPGPHGANMDCKLITAGSRVYLPVNVDGAMLALGDAHAVMADGEVCVSGVEVASEATLKVASVPRDGWPCPCVETDDSVWVLHSAATLDECETGALDAAADLLVEKGGLSVNDAACVLSCVGDLCVCQVVDPLKTMRVRLPKETLSQLDIALP